MWTGKRRGEGLLSSSFHHAALPPTRSAAISALLCMPPDSCVSAGATVKRVSFHKAISLFQCRACNMKIWHQAQVVAGCNEHAWELCHHHRSLCGALLHSLCLQGVGAEGAAVVVHLL